MVAGSARLSFETANAPIGEVCPAADPLGPPDAPVTTTFIDMTVGSRPLYAWLMQHGDPRAPLVILFQGGPTLGYQNPREDLFVRHFLAGNVDVLAVNYSGSSGAGLPLINRFALEGLAGIEQDAAQVSHLIRRRFLGRRLTIMGLSFGALPALSLDRGLADHEHRTALIAPLLKMRAPREWLSDGDSATYQEAFERRILGIDNGNREVLNSMLRGWMARRSHYPYFFALGARDLVSRPEDWTGPRQFGDATETVNLAHDRVGTDEGMLATLLTWVGGSSRSLDGE